MPDSQFFDIFSVKSLTDWKIAGITFPDENGGIGSINLKRLNACVCAMELQQGAGIGFVVNQDLMVFR